MKKRNRAAKLLRLKLISLAVASCFSAELALANPTGPVVANGQVSIIQNGNLLQITNSPSSIINWQSFSIGASEITRFLQQSASSAVLNRVITQNPSAILGALQSNGRVFLINPNGILFGAGAQVDVAGLVASSLNLSDTDFLAGRLRFTEMPGAGSVINQGAINAASGGQVYLVGPAVTNSGIITSPQGEVVLAAGNTVELVNPGTPNLRVEITAPDNQALNLGQIIADSGRIGIYAGLINQSGTVQANTAVVTEDGRIVLKATNNATFAPGSVTTATGPLEIEAGEILVAGNVTSGPQTINAGGGLLVQSTPGNFAQLTSNGGQTINAGFVEVTAQGAPATISNNFSGDQVITTSGMNASGEGLAVRTLGGGGAFASITLSAPGGQQVINVTNADRVVVDGAGGGAQITANFFNSQGQGQGLAQTLSVTGVGANAIHVGSSGGLGGSQIRGGSQNITAGASGQSGSITIVGPATNNQLAGIVSNGQQNVRTSGMISVTGGTAPAQPTNFPSGILHNGAGQQDVSAGGIIQQGGPSGSGNVANISAHTGSQQITVGARGITLTGGTGGTRNSAFLGALNGTQHVTVGAGGIAITGGSGGSNNNAQIQQTLPSGSQTITVDGGGITVQGGQGGTNNGAFLFGANQLITATGNVILSGGSGSGNSSIIGSLSGVATNLVLNAGGDVVLTGGSAATTGANIGSSGAAPLQPTNIAITAGGDVILNAGTGAGARIGSSINAPAAGGDISISAGGSIELNGSSTQAARIRTLGNVTLHADNPGGMISETPNGLIEANALTTTSHGSASLTGPNLVAVFNGSSVAGDVALSNTSPLLTVTGINQSPLGALTLNQTGDLAITGNAFSGAESISASGDITLAAGGSPLALTAAGPQAISAGGTLLVQGGTASGASAEIISSGPITITVGQDLALAGGTADGARAKLKGESVHASVGNELTLAGGTGENAQAWLFGNSGVDLTVGSALRLDAGSGPHAWAKVQTGSRDALINLYFPNLSSGGYFVNGIEGRIKQGQTGFFTDNKPAKLGDTLITTYGE